MRTIHYIILLPITLLAVALLASSCKISEESITQIHSKIKSDSLYFSANAAYTARGTRVQLSHGYFLELKNDTLKTHLPYFGIAYVAPNPSSDGGIKFTSTKFEYQKEYTDKGGWNIYIKTTDTREKYNLKLQINRSGYADLYIQEMTKQSISFYGQME